MENIEQQLLLFISYAYAQMGWPGVVVLMAIESACIPFPSELIMPLSGWMLIKNLGLSPIYTLVAGLYGALGNLIGSAIAYGVGMWGGRPFLEKYGRYVLISHDDLVRADHWFNRYGSLSIFVSRLLPVIRTFISLPAGIARMNLIKFCLYTFIGSFLWSTALAYLGYQLGAYWEPIRDVMRPFDYVIITAVVVLAGFYVYRHMKRARQTGKA